MDSRWPLNPQQRDLWLAQTLGGPSSAYTIPLWMELPAGTDELIFVRALARLAHEAPALRTRLLVDDGRAWQWFPDDGGPALERVDLSDRADPDAAARELTQREMAEPFVLEGGALCRWSLLRLGPDRLVWLWLIHHIALDAWGSSLLCQRVATLYNALAGGIEPEAAGFSHPGELAVEARDPAPGDFWARRLARLPAPLYGRTGSGGRARNLSLTLPRGLHQELAALAHERGVGASRLYLTLLAGLLGRLHGRESLCLGETFLNRPSPERLRCPGMFASELPLAVPTRPDAPVTELLAEASAEVSAVKAAPHSSLGALRGLAGLAPEEGLFDLSLSYVRQQSAVSIAGGHAPTRKLLPPQCQMPLWLIINQMDLQGDLEFSLQARASLMSTDEAAALGARFLTICRSLLARPGAALGDLEIMPESERHLVAKQWVHGPAPVAHAPSLDAAFSARAGEIPEQAALFWGETVVSYRELNEAAGSVAAALAGLGVGPGSKVGLSAPSSPALVAGLLGINRAGATFVLLPPEMPPARLADMAGQSDLAALAVWAAQPPPGCFSLPLLDLGAPLADQSAWAPPPPDPEGEAYVWFTSGSTGRPKGVVVCNRAIAHKIASTLTTLGGPSPGPMPVNASQSFDPFLTQLFCGLTGGGGARLLGAPERRDPARFWARVAPGMPCWLNTVPSLLEGLLPAAPPGAQPSLLLLGGEELTQRLAREARRRFPDAPIYNYYGPTEGTVDAVGCLVDPDDEAGRMPIGHPLPGYLARILDPDLKPVPAGVAGELCIGGPFLARGYLGLPEETARAFVPDPYSAEPGARLYRTGDAARWRFDGAIEFLGRLDQQVKVAGVRIEPGEVEAALESHPQVARAVVAAETLPGGGKRLVAYLVPAGPGAAPASGELRRFLARTLPAAMLPAAYRSIAAVPLLPSGKVDRQALAAAASAGTEPAQPEREPRGRAEREVAAVWADVLGLQQVDVEASFFEAGGTSLLLLTLHRRLGELPGYDLSLPDLMRRPTVRGIAEALGGDEGGADGPGAGEPALADKVAMVFARVLARPVGPDDSLLALGADSMSLARCLSALRRELGVNLRPAELLKEPTPRAAAELIAKTQGAGPAGE